MQAENRIRTAVSNNITPNVDDINKLKNLGASVKVGGQTFGAGSQTAIGGWKAIEKEAETSIRGWGKADFKNLKHMWKSSAVVRLLAAGLVLKMVALATQGA